jgi:SAM-dependent methyltransferase
MLGAHLVHNDGIRRAYDHVDNLPPLAKIVLILGLVLVAMYATRKNTTEPMTNFGKTTVRYDADIYDGVYADIYDVINYDSNRVEREIGYVTNSTTVVDAMRVLDVGSGAGHHVGALVVNGVDALGIDRSAAMIAKARKTYPAANFRQGDCGEAIMFAPGTFTHVLCLGSTIYEIKDKRHFMDNVYNWLRPGGYFVLQLTDEEQAKQVAYGAGPSMKRPRGPGRGHRVSRLSLPGMEYNAISKRGMTGSCWVKEAIKDKKTGEVRHNERRWKCIGRDKLVKFASQSGFTVKAMYRLADVGYPHEYVYLLVR